MHRRLLQSLPGNRQAKMKSFLKASWIAALMAGVAVSPVSADTARIHDQIGIEVANNNSAVSRCADELVKRSEGLAALAPQGLRAVPIEEIYSQQRNQTLTGKYIRPFVHVTDRSHEFDLIKVPFVFRDAEHVLAFLRSGEFYQQIRDNADQFSPTRLAIAYGGFFQMFSKVAAVTEPKHLYGRSIGGSVRQPFLYREFGAKIHLSSGIVGMNTGLDERAASDLGRDDRETQIVEAHLASAIENGFKGKGRFVNLVSSSMLVVDIVLSLSINFVVSPEEIELLRKWAYDAALACSEANYRKELETLEALKADGYQVVPFNRRALVERSWRDTLMSPHKYWTIQQLDKLVSLGNFPKGALLPSALLSKMSAKDRKQARDRDAVAILQLKAAAALRAAEPH